MRFEMDSPSPIPFAWVVKNGVQSLAIMRPRAAGPRSTVSRRASLNSLVSFTIPASTAWFSHSMSIEKIMRTGYPSIEHAAASVNLGADAYLFKPVNPKELLRVVEEKLREQSEA